MTIRVVGVSFVSIEPKIWNGNQVEVLTRPSTGSNLIFAILDIGRLDPFDLVTDGIKFWQVVPVRGPEHHAHFVKRDEVTEGVELLKAALSDYIGQL